MSNRKQPDAAAKLRGVTERAAREEAKKADQRQAARLPPQEQPSGERTLTVSVPLETHALIERLKARAAKVYPTKSALVRVGLELAEALPDDRLVLMVKAATRKVGRKRTKGKALEAQLEGRLG